MTNTSTSLLGKHKQECSFPHGFGEQCKVFFLQPATQGPSSPHTCWFVQPPFSCQPSLSGILVGDPPHLHGEDRGLEADDLNIIQLDSYIPVPCSYSMSTWAHPHSQAPQRVLCLFSSGNRQSGSQTPPLPRPLPLRSLCKEFLTSVSQPSVQIHEPVVQSAFAAVQLSCSPPPGFSAS